MNPSRSTRSFRFASVGVASIVSALFLASAAPAQRAMADSPTAMAQPLAEATPVVVQAPAPAPEEVPARRRVSYSAESMFGFGASALLPQGMRHLDTFARELSGTRYETVTVHGHTDRLGSAEYNQALSLRRAEAVKGYLVGAGKLDAAKVATIGMGESQPVTKAQDCASVKQPSKLVTCLQPDRRVEIAVAGTR